MSFADLSLLVKDELQAVNHTILQALRSPVEIINQIGHYLIKSGGKRIRPLVVLLSSHVCQAPLQQAITMAAIIEFIHTATLLHDDVIDNSHLRRGQPTANQRWDSPSAILVGDFLYSRAFQMMVALNNMPAMQILADATNTIAEGEVLQLTHRYQVDVDEKRYFNVIQLKTAKLFEAAAQLGGVLGHQPQLEKALAVYGLHLGNAFQLIDDVLDYQATDAVWGKNIGTDLAEGKITLPLIYALSQAKPHEAQLIRQAIQTGKSEDLSAIQQIMSTTGAIDYTIEKAKQETQLAIEALQTLSHSSYRDAMAALAKFAIHRHN